MTNKINTGGKIISIITGILALSVLPSVVSRNPDPQGLAFISLFGGATIPLFIRSFLCKYKLGWGQGIMLWIGGAIIGGQLMSASLQAWMAGIDGLIVLPNFRKAVALRILYGLLVGCPLLWLGFRKLKQKG